MTNPSNKPELPKGYRPFTSPQMRLETPQREGYHRHWFRGTPERIARAQQAGYSFVDPEDIGDNLNNMDLAGDPDAGGSTDMGSRVSVISGGVDEDSKQPGRLYLMECPLEYYEYAQSLLQEKNDSIAAALRGGTIGKGENGETYIDQEARYSKKKAPDLFIPKHNRRT